MDWPLIVGFSLVIIVAVIVTCSVTVSGLQQNDLLKTARQQSQGETALSEQEKNLLLELKRFWVHDEILAVKLDNFNVILMPDRKLVITLNRLAEQASVNKTGWLVLNLSAEEIAQDKEETVQLIQNYLQNPRLMNMQRVKNI